MPPPPRRQPPRPGPRPQPPRPRRKPRPRQKRRPQPIPQTQIIIVTPGGGAAPKKRRKPPSRTSMRAVVLALVAGLVWLVMSATGVPLPSIGGGGNASPPPADNALPSVSIEGSIPCRVNTKPIIQLTADRLHTCGEAKTYAKQKLAQKGQADQWSCQDQLWQNEASWSAWADNPVSSAYGIPQAIESLYGHVYDKGDWKKQVDWGLDYVWRRYKTPCAAWAFWQKQTPHWY